MTVQRVGVLFGAERQAQKYLLQRIIVACCVLHNMAIDFGDPPFPKVAEDDQFPPVSAYQGASKAAGIRYRDSLLELF